MNSQTKPRRVDIMKGSYFGSIVLALLSRFQTAKAYSSSSEKFFYSISTTSNSNSIDLFPASDGCADSCKVGSSIIQRGNLIIYDKFDQELCVDMVLSASFATSTASGTSEFCSDFSVQSVDGTSECPAPGEYSFEAVMTVTDLTSGFSFNVLESIYSCDGSSAVNITLSVYVASISAIAYGSIGLAGLILAVTTCRKRTQRIITTVDEAEEREGSNRSNIEFHTMDDNGGYNA